MAWRDTIKSRQEARVNIRENQQPTSSVTFSMMISETVYKVVVFIERVVRWFATTILRPCLLQLRCLFW